jgi:hypothetical protein
MEFQPGNFQQFKLEVIKNQAEKVLISRQGPGFFKVTTPVEIIETLRPYF